MIVAALSTFLAGCQTVPGGPARFGGGDGKVCVPADTGELVIIGDVFGAPASDDVAITSVSLTDAHGLELDHSYLIPIHNRTSIGAYRGDPSEIKGWGERVDAAGAKVAAGEDMSLALQLHRTGEADGTAGNIRVAYSVGRQSWVAVNTTAIVVAQTCG